MRGPTACALVRRLTAARAAAVAVAAAGAGLLVPAAGATVLRVGTYHGIKGQYRSIQAAVDAAKPGDWILIGPGDYKTHASRIAKDSADTFPTAILIQTAHLHVRGMNRNKVIVDGTKAGSPCNDVKANQNFGPSTPSGPAGLEGIMVYKADDVSVENLTACNFLAGRDGAGNEIWWNGGADTGGATTPSIGGWGFYGAYLTATSTWYDTSVPPAQAEVSAAAYGIFSSNWSGGTWDHTYASNFNDSGYYIGACAQQCDQVVDHAWSEYNAQGYSGSNSGGQLVIENSQFDNNNDGFDTNSQEGDNPPPQDGACPNNGISPITHTHSCWVFMDNYSHDNNNPNVPRSGLSGGTPNGTGLSLDGGRYDTIMHNRFARNGAWGTIIIPFPGGGTPCTGGVGDPPNYDVCMWDSWGVAVLDNTYSGNGFFGNPSNGDIGLSNFFPNEPTDCFSGNQDSGGTLTTAPANAQQMYPTCSGNMLIPSASTPGGAQFTDEVACDSTLALPITGKVPCAPNDHYPRTNYAEIHDGLHPLPPASELPTMPNPCKGVPANPWCRVRQAKRSRGVTRRARPHDPPAFTG